MVILLGKLEMKFHAHIHHHFILVFYLASVCGGLKYAVIIPVSSNDQLSILSEKCAILKLSSSSGLYRFSAK